jgi:hypothetical protein
VQERLSFQVDPQWCGHSLRRELALGGLEGPGRVVDVAAQNAPVMIDYV